MVKLDRGTTGARPGIKPAKRRRGPEAQQGVQGLLDAGAVRAVNNISFEIRRAGLRPARPQRLGKSTTIKILLGLLQDRQVRERLREAPQRRGREGADRLPAGRVVPLPVLNASETLSTPNSSGLDASIRQAPHRRTARHGRAHRGTAPTGTEFLGHAAPASAGPGPINDP